MRTPSLRLQPLRRPSRCSATTRCSLCADAFATAPATQAHRACGRLRYGSSHSAATSRGRQSAMAPARGAWTPSLRHHSTSEDPAKRAVPGPTARAARRRAPRTKSGRPGSRLTFSGTALLSLSAIRLKAAVDKASTEYLPPWPWVRAFHRPRLQGPRPGLPRSLSPPFPYLSWTAAGRGTATKEPARTTGRHASVLLARLSVPPSPLSLH